MKKTTQKTTGAIAGAAACLLSLVGIGCCQKEDVSALNARQQGIVKIAALTATGKMETLPSALNEGLDAGLTVNEVKEILVQLYAYAGFPRSLNALTAFMNVLEERQAQGKQDPAGQEPSSVPASGKYELGKKTLGTLLNNPAAANPAPYGIFAPAADTFLKEHLFADIFGRGVLSYSDRELATVAALSSIPGVNSQLQGHLNMALNTGLTPQQLRAVTALVRQNISCKAGKNATGVLNTVLQSR